MNLMRPVSVLDHLRTKKSSARKASFYIEKGALKALHLTSDTTSEQVVQALLNKYSITDNPMKFALFEKQVREEGHVILRKMLQRERPLFLRLLWGNGNNDRRGFILQENESRDIHWESFSIAELLMFIKILDKEEGDYIAEIKRKYRNKAQDIRNAIDYQNKNS
uniref:Ras-associating domain-containing protein n=1 Tax=Ciona savignyi TaxID=51511 RepID=H2Z764_CIOSA